MLILIILSAIALICFIIWFINRDYGYEGYLIFSIVFTFFLVIGVTAIPFCRYNYNLKYKQLEVFKQSLQQTRIDMNNQVERAAVFSKITEWNDFIIETKSYRENVFFNIYIPARWADEEIIK